jgi:hypothetical protein
MWGTSLSSYTKVPEMHSDGVFQIGYIPYSIPATTNRADVGIWELAPLPAERDILLVSSESFDGWWRDLSPMRTVSNETGSILDATRKLVACYLITKLDSSNLSDAIEYLSDSYRWQHKAHSSEPQNLEREIHVNGVDSVEDVPSFTL